MFRELSSNHCRHWLLQYNEDRLSWVQISSWTCCSLSDRLQDRLLSCNMINCWLQLSPITFETIPERNSFCDTVLQLSVDCLRLKFIARNKLLDSKKNKRVFLHGRRPANQMRGWRQKPGITWPIYESAICRFVGEQARKIWRISGLPLPLPLPLVLPLPLNPCFPPVPGVGQGGIYGLRVLDLRSQQTRGQVSAKQEGVNDKVGAILTE